MRLQSTTKLRRVPLKKHGEYKYLVHMPGAIRGSYSRHLQFALGMGAVVLKWDSPFFDFYYDWLEAGRHFVPVNATNIVRKIEALNEHQFLAERLALVTHAWLQ